MTLKEVHNAIVFSLNDKRKWKDITVEERVERLRGLGALAWVVMILIVMWIIALAASMRLVR